VQQMQISSEVKFIVGCPLPWFYVMKESHLISAVTVNVGGYRDWVKFSELLAHKGISPDLCGIVL